MPAPADVQTANNGATPGKAETGDTVTFTFAGPVPPSLVLAGWSGAATAVIAHFDHQGGVSSLEIQGPSGTPISALGSVDLERHYTNTVDFTGSTMTASGNTITVELGTPDTPGGLHTISSPTTLTWTAPTGSANESGVPDIDF